MGAAELAFIEEAFRSNYIAPVGPHVDAFEKEFCSQFGFRHAAAVSSGTAAIHLALRMLGVKAGDEVVCSTLTFAASANPIVYENARPVFIDSDEATWNMDPVLLERWLDERALQGRLPRAVVAVELYGQCADLIRIARACAKHNVPLIEDSAEALGATFCGRPAGSFGKMAIFSFNGNKIITTSGGGMLVSDDAKLIAQAKFLSTQARDPGPHYQHSQLGFNYRLSNVLAGIGRAQLQVVGERVNARRRIFAYYAEALKDLPGLAFMPEAPQSRSNRWLTCFTVDPKKTDVTSAAICKTLDDANIEARAVWKPLHLQPVFSGCEVVGGGVAERLFAQGVCLPSGSAMTENELQRVVRAVRAAFPKSAAWKAPRKTVDGAAERGERFVDILAVMARERLGGLTRSILGFCDRHISRNGALRVGSILAVYTVELASVFVLSYAFRWDFATPADYRRQMMVLIVPVVLCKLVLLWSFGQFRTVMSYFGLADFGGVVLSIGTVSSLMLGLWYGAALTAAPPRGVIVMDFILSVAAISAFRICLRLARTWSVSGQLRPGSSERRVAIIGAGDAGEVLAKELLQRRGCGLYPVLFIDNDPERIGRSIHGLTVHGPIDRLERLSARARVNEFVITLVNPAPELIRRITEIGRVVGATTQIIPSFLQLASGEIRIEQSRPVAIEDLLGREQVNLDSTGISGLLKGRIVMVTGAGGSIGSELCRQIMAHQPKKLVMLDQSELVLFEIDQELMRAERSSCLVPIITDVADEHSVRAVLREQQPEIIFHAAAHKHVPLMERQPAEALKNNTFATMSLMRVASQLGVERFVFISTDKAINPTSVMGCSKRLAEKALQQIQFWPGNRTAFLAVRFGNVLGSSGSVIPTFKRQIAQGGPVTVTHRDMTRYFMTIPEAVGLVLQTGTLGNGGDIFILDMGRPVKIYEMARQMIELSGLKPDVDIQIAITGLRPGEKLFEELQHSDETHVPTEHHRIFKLKRHNGSGQGTGLLKRLRAISIKGTPDEIKREMKRLVPEYTPYFSGEVAAKIIEEPAIVREDAQALLP